MERSGLDLSYSAKKTIWRLFLYLSDNSSRPDFSSLVSLLHEGDLIEFHRAGPPSYCHWGVYIGSQEVGGVVTPCLVHRANPADSNLGISSSNSLRKGELGIGAVVLEPLSDVWGDSIARINNTMDTSLEPLPRHTGINRY